MTKATTRRFFFGGTIVFTLVFVALTIHTHTTIAARTHEEALTPEVVRGLHVWSRYNCENCHTLLGEGAYYAPDLTRIVDQKGAAYLGQFLRDPSRFFSEERDGRLMPTLGLSDGEITDVIAFLDWVGNIDTNGWPPRPIIVSGVVERGPSGSPQPAEEGAAATGAALYNGIAGCVACHAIEPGVIRVGPSLAGIASQAQKRIESPDYGGAARTPQEYLRESILSPNAYLAGQQFVTPDGLSFMPNNYGTSLLPDQVDALVNYLMTLSEEEPSS